MVETNYIGTVTELADQYRQGDAAAGEALAGALRETLVRRFTNVGVDRHDCEDLAQQCLVDIFGMFDRFDAERGSAESWTAGIARNVLRNWWRRRKVLGTYETSLEPHADFLTTEESADSELSLQEAMSDLPLIDRELIHMRFALAMPFADIAEAANITPMNARKRVSRAVESLRRHPSVQALIA